MNTQYWFYIENYVHVNIKKSSALLYNPYTGKILEVHEPRVLELLRKMQISRNMGVISLDAQTMSETGIQNTIDTIRSYFMGDLLDKRFSIGKPVVMNPIVKVQKEVEILKRDATRSIGENILNYVTSVSLYVNSRCGQACSICSTAYRQTHCCTVQKKGAELDFTLLQGFLAQLAHASMNLHILGGNLLEYSQLGPLMDHLETMKCRKTFWINYLNIASGGSALQALAIENVRLSMLVQFPLNEELFRQAVDGVRKANLEIVPVFLVQNYEEYNRALTLSTDWNLENSDFVPVFNGANEDFFKDSFFLSKEDIESIKPSLNDIYMTSKINPTEFGKLTVMPDGKVYANVNNVPLGQLGKISVVEMLMKELKNRNSWRLTRKQVEPCKECIYQELCPGISNYSRVMNRFNLCNVR